MSLFNIGFVIFPQVATTTPGQRSTQELGFSHGLVRGVSGLRSCPLDQQCSIGSPGRIPGTTPRTGRPLWISRLTS
jgi:hypothetical protein